MAGPWWLVCPEMVVFTHTGGCTAMRGCSHRQWSTGERELSDRNCIPTSHGVLPRRIGAFVGELLLADDRW
jgi:hypothetical protein